ncbi:MAG TPA: lysine--tRNA ligase [Deltaproteobacteria bacterium]|nr:lysine--tRNA ligase [Deltaproteobacteria bacterium]
MSEAERESRRARLEALRAQGIEPYPARMGPRQSIAEVRLELEPHDAEALDAQARRIAIAGRVTSMRSFGRLRFFDLVENGARIQASARMGEAPDAVFQLLDQLDVGDFVRVEGRAWRTRTGELTVAAEALQLLAKSLRPLPEKWHGLADVEARFRQRYLDLLVNQEVRRVALVRSRTISALRAFLDARGFLEVETPVLQPLYGGAAARPFTTRHNLYAQDLYLRISDELYLKRLIVGGIDRVYEIGRNFRNEGVSRKHNPEFTMMECYQAFADYGDMMDLAQDMLREAAERVLGTLSVMFQGKEIDLSGTWPRHTMRDAILEATKVDILDSAASTPEQLAEAVKRHKLEIEPQSTWGKTVDELFSKFVEPSLVQPTFITDYPIELSPLAKRKADDPRLVERFELFVAGMELGNAFSELNDPDDQRARFERARREAKAGDEEAHPMDEDFLRALEHGMPPTGGLGIGVDRVAMVLADAPSLRETILFPHLRPEHS